MTLYSDCQQMIGAIKHCPDTVDLDDVRCLLRQVQDYCARVDEVLEHATVMLPGEQLGRLLEVY